MSSPGRYKPCRSYSAVQVPSNANPKSKVVVKRVRIHGYEHPAPNLKQFRECYGRSGWDWPQAAGSSLGSDLGRLRLQLDAVQLDVRSRVGDLTQAYDVTTGSVPVTYTYDELLAMTSRTVHCPVRRPKVVGLSKALFSRISRPANPRNPRQSYSRANEKFAPSNLFTLVVAVQCSLPCLRGIFVCTTKQEVSLFSMQFVCRRILVAPHTHMRVLHL